MGQLRERFWELPLAELDRALKGGSRLPGELEFSRTLVDLTARREPLGAKTA